MEFKRRAPEYAPACRVCGCWELDACVNELMEPCSWVEPDLCSHCWNKEQSGVAEKG